MAAPPGRRLKEDKREWGLMMHLSNCGRGWASTLKLTTIPFLLMTIWRNMVLFMGVWKALVFSIRRMVKVTTKRFLRLVEYMVVRM